MNNTTLINATTTITSTTDLGTAISLFFTVLIPELFYRYLVFFITPFTHLEMWWLLIHLLLTFILFEFYFERHGDEDLGWTAALANSIVMFFISMELLRKIYGHEKNPFVVLWEVLLDYLSMGFSEQMFLVTLVLLLGAAGIVTAVINYYHLLPKRIAFMVSGHKTVNLLAYFLMVVVFRQTYGNSMPLDGLTLIALVMFGLTMWGLLMWINNYKRRRRNPGPGPARRSLFRPFN